MFKATNQSYKKESVRVQGTVGRALDLSSHLIYQDSQDEK